MKPFGKEELGYALGRRTPIHVENAGKKYTFFRRPADRLLHSLSAGRLGGGKEFWALKDVSFEVKAGSTLGVIGANGSGKSTLLQLIAGTLKPTTGVALTRGRVAALLELGAGFNPELTGRENVELSCALYGLTPAEMVERIPQIEDFAEIGMFLDQPVKQYSSGMFVRLAFAVIAHVDAEVLIVDEALAVGDAYFQQKCMRFMHDFMGRGTVLFVSHDMASIKSLCTDALWLQQGQIVEIGSPKAVGDAYLKSQYALSQAVNAPSSEFLVSIPEAEMEITADVKDSVPSKASTNSGHVPFPDVRLEAMHEDGVQNRLQIFQFTERVTSFGAGKAQVVSTELLDTTGARLIAVEGGETVVLRIRAKTLVDIDNPIFGFFVRNRLGLNVFGDNTYLVYREYQRSFSANTLLEGRFGFVMPFLPKGDYSVCVAIATGTNENHEQQHWVNEALILRSLSSDVHADLLGIPMHEISIGVSSDR
ncbi:MAG: ABC transporter ATP-binding protein [Ramlibacter sp.]|nr:ABC transporter ATP-binding protein [Ramlibacter sp.]